MGRTTWVRSQPITWVASQTFNVDLQVLSKFAGLSAGVVKSIRIQFTGTADTGSSGGPSNMFPMVFDRVVLGDIGGDVVNCKGSSLRALQYVYGGYADPDTIAASQTGATMNFYLDLPIGPAHQWLRRNDFGINVRSLLDGGRLALTTRAGLMATNYITTASGTIYVWFEVADDRVPEGKSRLLTRDQAITRSEDMYTVGGALATLLFYNGEVNEKTSTAWSAQNFRSNTLDLFTYPDTLFIDWYKREHTALRMSDRGSVSTNSVVANEDPQINGMSIPIVFPKSGQKLLDLQFMATCHLATDASITTSDLPQVITQTIVSRSADANKRIFAVSDPSSEIASNGRTKLANGNRRGLIADPALQNIMPVKLSK